MKRGGGKRRRRAANEVPGNFVRGFVATGLLTALQEGKGGAGLNAEATLRSALRGGAALAAGSAAADALRRRHYSRVLLTLAGAAAGMMAIDYLAGKPGRTDKRGKRSGKEKT